MSSPVMPPHPAAVVGRFVAVGAPVTLVVALYGWLSFGVEGRVVVPYLLLAYLATTLASLPMLAWMVAPLRRLRHQIAQGVPQLSLPAGDVVAALRLPVRAWQLVMIQFVVALVAAPLLAHSWLPALATILRPVLVGGTAYALVCSVAQFYAMNNLTIREIAPALMTDGTLRHLPGAPLVRVWHHLVFTAVSCGLALPAFVWVAFSQGAQPTWLSNSLLAVTALSLFAFQIISVNFAVARAVGHLSERMQEVRDGHLETRARVDGLDTLAEMSSTFNTMVDGLQQRERIKETFGRYVAAQVAEEILAGRIALGGELRTATVLFSDIRGFTRMSERMTPIEVVAFLNEYLTAMVACVTDNGGVVDKFIGDAVMAVFGTPVSEGPKRDAERAVRCAMAMSERLASINQRRALEGKPAIRIGIGLHTGELVAGNIGSPQRMEYTVIGDTVNVCARLESLTKDLGRRTVLSAATAALVGDIVEVVELGNVELRGRNEAMAVHGLACEDAVAIQPEPLR